MSVDDEDRWRWREEMEEGVSSTAGAEVGRDRLGGGEFISLMLGDVVLLARYE